MVIHLSASHGPPRDYSQVPLYAGRETLRHVVNGLMPDDKER